MAVITFKSKRMKVQDYPDRAFTITIYGTSKKSKFKLNDRVITINNKRISYGDHRIIGFDSEGDAMLAGCAWANTRGGYSDDCLVSFKDFEQVKKNLPEKFKEDIDKKIKEHQKFLIDRKFKGKKDSDNIMDDKIISIITNNYLAENWYKLDSLEQRLAKWGLKMPENNYLLPLGATIQKYDRIVMSSSSSDGKHEIKWDFVFHDWPGHNHNNEDHIIIRRRPIVGETKIGDWNSKYTQEDLDKFNKIFNIS